MKNVHLSKWMGVVLGVVLLGWSSGARAASESAAGLTDAASRPLDGPTGSMAAQPPEPAAAETLAVYLRGLADTDYSKALFCVDLDGLRAYLLDRRLAELKRSTPGLGQNDLAELSATFQTRELAPERIKTIMVQGWQKDGLKDMTWRVCGWIPGPAQDDIVTTVVAAVDAELPDTTVRRIYVPLRKSDDGWLVAPDILEKLAEARPAVPAEVPMPEPIAAVVETFWNAWKANTPEAAWSLMDESYRKRVSAEAFSAHHADLARRYGPVYGWKVEHVRQITSDILAIGLALQTVVPTQGLMIFRLNALQLSWSLVDVQFRTTEGTTPQPAAATAPSPAPSMATPDAPPAVPGPADVVAPSVPQTPPSSLAPPSLKTDFKPQL